MDIRWKIRYDGQDHLTLLGEYTHMKLRAFCSIVACRLCRKLLRLLGRGGTDFPGRVALKLYPSLLAVMARGFQLVEKVFFEYFLGAAHASLSVAKP